jgi:tRNA dimethylallyltransferase
MSTPNIVIIIGGPTASGKTAIAIRVAAYFKTEIISADSRQCYKELKIGVARPSDSELQEVPHHFIATHSVYEPANAALFEQYALDLANSLFEKSNVVVVAGGTGLYLKAFCEGLDPIPGVNAEVRQAARADYKAKGLAWLQSEVQSVDPLFYGKGEHLNPHRLLRALEVKLSTGFSILDLQRGAGAQRPFQIIPIALDPPRDTLAHNINQRVDAMIAAGLEDEVRSLQPARHLPPLQTVGYKEMFSFLDGAVKHSETVERIKISTRQYAKRQRTWFRGEKSYHWMSPNAATVIEYAVAANRAHTN